MTRISQVQEWGVYIAGPDIVGWELMKEHVNGKEVFVTSTDRVLMENTATTLRLQRPYHTVKAMLVIN